MLKGLLILLVLILSAACGTPEENSVSGHIERFDSDTIFLTKRYKFLISASEQPNFDQMIEGTPVTIYYRGKLTRTEVKQALRVEVNPIYFQLLGSWIEEGGDGDEMGVELLVFDHARSIGMQSVAFKSWSLTKEGKLRLTGLVHGSGSTVNFSEDWDIEYIGSSHMTISQKDMKLHFKRRVEELEPILDYEAL